MDNAPERKIFFEDEISEKNYTASLLTIGRKYGLISEKKYMEILTVLNDQFTELLGQYTKRQSSSVRRETAETIYSSLLYCADISLKTVRSDRAAIDVLNIIPITMILEKGRNLILNVHTMNRVIYRKTEETKLENGTDEYKDLFRGVFGQYYKTYSARFNARECCISVDYPLMGKPAYALKSEGAYFIKEYYSSVLLENSFCRVFEKEKTDKLLYNYGRKFSTVYFLLHFNIAEIIANNYFSRLLLDRTEPELVVSEEDAVLLCRIYSVLSLNDVRGKLNSYIEDQFKDKLNNSAVRYLLDYAVIFSNDFLNRTDSEEKMRDFLTVY